MPICLLFILFISSIITTCSAAEVKQTEAIVQASVEGDLPPVRSMLIFMDTSETTWGAVSSDLIAALEQKAAPIIVSGHLLRTVFTQPTLEQFVATQQQLAQENPDDTKLQEDAKNYQMVLMLFNAMQKNISRRLPLYKKSQDLKSFLTDVNRAPDWNWKPYWDATYKERTRSLLHFNPEQWFIEYARGFFILIPKTYIPILADTSFSSCTPKTLSSQQLSLGLKLGCLGMEVPASRFADVITVASTGTNFVQLLCGEQTKDNKCASSIFITRSEYTKQGITIEKMPRWIIYVVGHGSLNGSIAGFDVLQFQQLLNFCETKIATQLFMYKTCFGASSHTAELFLDKERKEKNVKNYSFPIMCGAIPDVVVYGPRPTMGIPGKLTPDDIDLDSGILRLHTFPHFKKSFTLAAQETIPYKELVPTLIPKQLSLENLMLVKPAYLEWTSLVDADNVTVSIPKKLALTRTKPLAISTLTKKGAPGPQAILLYAHHMPFEIIIDTNPTPKLISMIPGKCFHVIDKITVPMRSLDFVDQIKEFLPDVPKILWIKKIQGSSNPTPTENVIIDITNKKNYIVYTTRVGEYRRREIIDGTKQPDTVSENPADNYVAHYTKLLEDDGTYQQEETERKQIAAIAKIHERKKRQEKEE